MAPRARRLLRWEALGGAEHRLNTSSQGGRGVECAMRFSILLACLLASVPVAAADRPNIVFIMSDDHAAHAIGAYGSRVNTTPHLDRLAREGMRMDRVFATNAICTPSRATILTGQYSHVNGCSTASTAAAVPSRGCCRPPATTRG
jgi:hypothetical protein